MHPYRTPIPSVPFDEQARPLWSVMIPTYNCADYLRKTLATVLAQDPGPAQMQIEVVDDASQDDPAAVVADVGRGRVQFFRQPANVGHLRNFDTCLQRSRGRLVHLLHGDDFVYEGFYATLAQAFASQPTLGAAFCRQVFVDEEDRQIGLSPREVEQSGLLVDGLARLATEQRIMTPSIVVARGAYEQLGGFDQRLVCSEDWEMWVRLAAQFPVWYEVEALAAYRIHLNSNTGRHVRSGEDMYYTNMAIDIFSHYLPQDRARGLVRQAKETYALAALRTARKLAHQEDWVGMGAQMREAWRMSPSWRIARQSAPLLLQWAKRRASHSRNPKKVRVQSS
jgi:glycosyltransferase involved in cell wall biosynthesis